MKTTKPSVPKKKAEIKKVINKDTEKQKYKVKKEHPLARKVILMTIAITVTTILLFFALFIAIKKFTQVKSEQKIATVNAQLTYCQELVVEKFKYSDVLVFKKSAGLSKSYSVVKYSGIVRAGIKDLSSVNYEISPNGKEIFLEIPESELLGNDIVSQEVFDEKQSIFVKIKTQEIFDEIEKAKTKVASDLIRDGLLDDSWAHAATIIKQFMYGCGFESVIIKRGLSGI